MTEPTARRRGSSGTAGDQDHAVAKVEIDPSFVITHRLALEEAPRAYRTFNDKAEDRTRVVLRPQERKDGHM